MAGVVAFRSLRLLPSLALDRLHTLPSHHGPSTRQQTPPTDPAHPKLPSATSVSPPFPLPEFCQASIRASVVSSFRFRHSMPSLLLSFYPASYLALWHPQVGLCSHLRRSSRDPPPRPILGSCRSRMPDTATVTQLFEIYRAAAPQRCILPLWRRPWTTRP